MTLQSYRLRPCSPAAKCPVSSLAMLAYYFTLTFSDEVGCSDIRRERILMRPSPLRLSCSGMGSRALIPPERCSAPIQKARPSLSQSLFFSVSRVSGRKFYTSLITLLPCHPGSPCFDRAASLYGALCVGFLDIDLSSTNTLSSLALFAEDKTPAVRRGAQLPDCQTGIPLTIFAAVRDASRFCTRRLTLWMSRAFMF